MKNPVKLNRIDGISASAENEGGIRAAVESVSGINASLNLDDIPFFLTFNKDGSIEFRAERLDGIECTFTYTDKPDIGNKYLEIEPEIIWVYPDLENFNNVYSNVTWLVN